MIVGYIITDTGSVNSILLPSPKRKYTDLKIVVGSLIVEIEISVLRVLIECLCVAIMEIFFVVLINVIVGILIVGQEK